MGMSLPPEPSGESRQPFRRAISTPDDLPPMVETEFEHQRGVIETELREGFALFLVHSLPDDLDKNRLHVLKVVADANVSIDFLKLTTDGLSFVVPEALSDAAGEALANLKFPLETSPNRSVLSAWSPNLRDEEGLAARLVSAVIASGARLDHVSDMHDRILFLLDQADAEKATQAIREVAKQ